MACGTGDLPSSEESVEMVMGSYRTVAEGRAEILIGEVGELEHEETGLLVDAVEVEVTCGEETRVLSVTEDHPTGTVCRIELQLVEITNWAPPKVKLIVRWRP